MVVVVVVAAVAAAGRAVRRAAVAAAPRFLLPTAGFDRGTSRLVPRARAVRDGPSAEARQAPVVFAPRIRAAAAKVRVPLRPRRPAVGGARRRRVDDTATVAVSLLATDHLVRVRSLAVGRVPAVPSKEEFRTPALCESAPSPRSLRALEPTPLAHGFADAVTVSLHISAMSSSRKAVAASTPPDRMDRCCRAAFSDF